MFDITGLLLPLLTLATFITSVALTMPHSLLIGNFSVPESMTQKGYSPDVFVGMIDEGILKIEAKAQPHEAAQWLRIQHDKGVFAVALDMLRLTPLVRAVQETTKLIEYKVEGDVVEVGDEYVMHMRVERFGTVVKRHQIAGPRGSVETLSSAAAMKILKLTDPQIVCASVMRDEARALVAAGAGVQTSSFPKTRDCLAELLPDADPGDQCWLYNLQGVVDFFEGRRADAVASFREALDIDPDFAPALLNAGILFADDGNYDEAIKYFKQIFRSDRTLYAPRIYAAALTEWGDALAHLGRNAEAEDNFARAIKADPKYADAWVRWAGHTANPAIAKERTARGEAIAKRYGEIYTGGVIGKLKVSAARSATGALEQRNLEGALGDTGLLVEPSSEPNYIDATINSLEDRVKKFGTFLDRILRPPFTPAPG